MEDFDAYFDRISAYKAISRNDARIAWLKQVRLDAKAKSATRRGVTLPTPKVAYKNYLKTRAWKNKRKEAIKHHGGKCAVCGCDGKLDVHHLTYSRLGKEKMSDLQLLCRQHHREAHGITQ